MESLKIFIKKREDILKKIKSIDNFMKGSIYLLKRKCSNPNCKCHHGGDLHSSYVLTYSHSGKTKILSLRKEDVAETKKLTENYNKLKQMLIELTEINIKIIKLQKQISNGNKKK